MSYFQYPRYVSVSEKRARAEKKIRQLRKKNSDLAPVIIEGRTLARTWWGQSWNANLERYADYRNRIERGRSYVRHLAVLDLRIDKGAVSALVQGSRSKPYAVDTKIEALPKTNWGKLTAACADHLDSLQDLLAGRFPKALAHLFMAKGSGLFPTPEEIQFSCSCPDWASMCKHVAATLYGIGARLDQDPSLFFMLRRVNMDDLIAKALEETTDQWIQKAEDHAQSTIAEADLGDVFGIDMDAMPDFGTITAEAAAIHSVTDKPKKATRPHQGTSRKQPKIKAVDEKTRILDLVRRAAKGITAVELHQKSGIAIVKIRNVLYQAYRQGAIEKASRGVYRAKAAQPKQLSVADRQVAVLAAVRATPKGIRAPQVAEATGLLLATVRPVMARLLAEGALRRISRGVYGPPSPTRKKKSTTATGAILSMIKTHPKGVSIAALKEQSGCEEKQLRNIIFRLFKSGKIRRAERGIYIAASERK